MGWHTALVDHIEPTPGVLLPRVLARWLLLGAIIAGVFGLHTLTGDHGTRGAFPVAIATDLSDQSPQESATVLAPGLWDGSPLVVRGSEGLPVNHGDDLLADCLLFLTAAGISAVLMLALIRRRLGDSANQSGNAASLGIVRFPPCLTTPRVALGVIRV